MGRPPCCEKIGVKKGPWTPEEDLMLVSYIQDHGPGNWRAVPTNTGLMRCSKSCRLRWTNYLRPGIKRGNFTEHEERLIVHLQALLGNRWAAIASYLPERTDNDIKNYWNTHLNKKLKKLQNGQDGGSSAAATPDAAGTSTCHSLPKGQWERRLQTDVHTAKQALRRALSFDHSNPSSSSGRVYSWTPKSSQKTTAATALSTISYASSAENISRLLEGWTTKKKSSPTTGSAAASAASNSGSTQQTLNYKSGGSVDSASSSCELKGPFGAGANIYAAAAVAPLRPTSSSLNIDASKTSIIFQGEIEQSAPEGAAEAPVAVTTTLFESWLFDEAMEQLGEASGLVDMAMEDYPNGLFQID